MPMVATCPLNSRFLGNFSRVTTGDSLSTQQQVLQKFCGVKRSDSSLLPNSRFAENSYDWSVMSSIVGPSLDSVLPKTILPMEVITVSRYTSPVVSSFTTQLELMLKRPGFDTIPMDIGPTGIPWSTSTSYGLFKQATTPAKLWGSVGSLTSANILASRGDLGGDGAFGGLGGGLMEIVLLSWSVLLFTLSIAVGWGVSPAATTGWDGCITMFHFFYLFGLPKGKPFSFCPTACLLGFHHPTSIS